MRDDPFANENRRETIHRTSSLIGRDTISCHTVYVSVPQGLIVFVCCS